MRNYVDAFNHGNLPALRERLAGNAEIQVVMGQGMFEKVEPIWRQLLEGYGKQLSIEELVAEGHLVSARYTETGTFKAPAFGNPPTCRSCTLVAMDMFELQAGTITRRWGARDSAAQARQLGISIA